MEIAVIVIYLAAMVGIGFWGRARARSESDFLVAGRRLGPLLYSGTMAAVVLGGASTIGGVGLGYQHGISGMWLVVAIGVGICVLSLAFAGKIQRLGVYTVTQMLELRYGRGGNLVSGIIMMFYALFLATTSTVAYGTIFKALFGFDTIPSVLLGGGIVIAYSILGGMWSITLTDFVQFVIKTIGIFLILLPVVISKAGGFGAMQSTLDPSYFSLTSIGGDMIITYFVIYGFGLLIGQDIWQRVFTARTPEVARWGGLTAGVYCLAYGAAGALVGTAAKVLLPNVDAKDDVFAQVVELSLHPILAGLVLAAALSAVMSTSSGCLIASATVANKDVVSTIFKRSAGDAQAEVQKNRIYILVMGVAMLILACVLPDVISALTVAYNILVGGLLIAILGGLVWKRGTLAGALASMAVGAVVTVVSMIIMGLLANQPIYYGLLSSLVVYVVVSLLTKPTDPAILAEWDRRVRHGVREDEMVNPAH
ncbi:sodium:solute symporter [Micrococcales bacterium 31B]|nr:sodium:solute symporter [Micrococcales bacterium 31B]